MSVKIQEIHQRATEQLKQLFETARAPYSAAKLRQHVAEQLFCELFNGTSLLDSAFNPFLQLWQPIFVSRVAAEDNFYCDEAHPLRRVLQCLIQNASYWYPRNTKISQQFFEKISSLLNAAAHYSSEQPQQLVANIDAITEWLSIEAKRAALLESRLCENEMANLHTLAAHKIVVAAINQAMGNKLFPTALSKGIEQTLKSELLHSLYTEKSESRFWKSWQVLLPLLGHVFSYKILDEQQLYRNVPAMLNELERHPEIKPSSSAAYHEWISLLSEHLVLAVKKQSIPCEPFIPLTVNDEPQHVKAAMTSRVLDQLEQLGVGSWMRFWAEEQKIIRCKLALKDQEADIFMFVDHNGRKVMTKSSKEIGMCLSTGIMQPLHTYSVEDKITLLLNAAKNSGKENQHITTNKITDSTPKNQGQSIQDTNKKTPQPIAATSTLEMAKTELQKKLSMEKAARHAAAQKALREANTIETAKTHAFNHTDSSETETAGQTDTTNTATAQLTLTTNDNDKMTAQLQRMQLASIKINALNLGAKVELIQKGLPVTCKLAVIIAATGKYVFVDKIGRKVAEFQREELLQAMINNQLTLINSGNSFDDQLAKIIRGLRKDIS